MVVISTNKTEKYKMSFGTGGLFLNESVAIARIFQELNDWQEVKRVAGKQGVIPFNKQSSIDRSVREIANRLSVLKDSEIDLLCNGDHHEKISVLWLAMCRAYRFIGEFAREIVLERFLSFRTLLTYDDFDVFYQAKAEWEPELDAISASTRKKLRQILFRIMREAGVLSHGDIICQSALSPRFLELVLKSDPTELAYFPGADLGGKGRI